MNSRRGRSSKRSAKTPANQQNFSPLEKIASSADGELLASNHNNTKPQLINHTKFEGPLPHPDIFRQYGEIIPDAPERILSVFEKDSSHIRDIKTQALAVQKQDNMRVHWMAWSLIIAGYLSAAFFALIDKDWLAGITLASTIGGTIMGFLQKPTTQAQTK